MGAPSSFWVGLCFVVTTSLSSSRADSVVVLTEANFDELVHKSGKAAIVKFYAPWCGHCKSLKPVWDTLGSEYSDSTSVLIGDVDCTSSEAGKICETHEVSGYPTLKYFNTETGEKGADYDGGRELSELQEFVAQQLGPKCLVGDTSACSEKEAAFIAKMKSKPDGVAEELTRLEGMLGKAMAPDLKKWLKQRIALLKQLVAAA